MVEKENSEQIYSREYEQYERTRSWSWLHEWIFLQRLHQKIDDCACTMR